MRGAAAKLEASTKTHKTTDPSLGTRKRQRNMAVELLQVIVTDISFRQTKRDSVIHLTWCHSESHWWFRLQCQVILPHWSNCLELLVLRLHLANTSPELRGREGEGGVHHVPQAKPSAITIKVERQLNNCQLTSVSQWVNISPDTYQIQIGKQHLLTSGCGNWEEGAKISIKNILDWLKKIYIERDRTNTSWLQSKSIVYWCSLKSDLHWKRPGQWMARRGFHWKPLVVIL